MPLSTLKPSIGTHACSAPFDLVVLGVSTGGVDLLMQVIPALPASFPVPIIVCIHAPAATTAALAQWLDARSAVQVREAEDRQRLQCGRVYLAPGGYHLYLEADGTCSLSVDAPEKFSRPSIDVLFESAGRALRERLLAVVLTGANDDGAMGAACVKAFGGRLIVQDPDDAQVADMPRAALAKTAADAIVPAAALAPLLLQWCSQGL